MTPSELQKARAKYPISEDVARRSLGVDGGVESEPCDGRRQTAIPCSATQTRTREEAQCDTGRSSGIANSGSSAPPIHTHLIVRPSTDEANLNKTEKAYLAWLKTQGYEWIGIQNVTLKLGDDCRYTCDFFVITVDGQLHGREVKGFFRDDAKAKIKIAARQFPWIHFSVVTREKGGAFNHQSVKP